MHTCMNFVCTEITELEKVFDINTVDTTTNLFALLLASEQIAETIILTAEKDMHCSNIHMQDARESWQ